jgi:DNA-binding transcriptional LysR family regulator
MARAVAMVAQGCGIALVPHSLASAKIAGVRFPGLEGAPSPVPASLVWNPSNVPMALNSFLASAKKTIRKLKRTGKASTSSRRTGVQTPR